MTTFFSHTYQRGDHAGRPSLYGRHMNAQTDAEAFSILGKLEPNRNRQKSAWRIVWTAPLLSLAAVAFVVGLNGGFRNVAMSSGTVAESPRKEERAQSAESGQAADVMLAAPAGNAEAATTAAEPFPSQDRGQQVDEPAPFIDDASRGISMAQAAYDAPPAVVMATNAVSSRATFEEAKTSSVSGHASERATQPKPIAKAQTKPTPRKVAKDKDVELIGALLAHVSEPSTAPAKMPSRNPAAGAATTRIVPGSAATRRARNVAPARDSVRQAADDSIETQVKRCGELGFFEGEVCRLRACSDLWGKTSACPPSMPAATDS